MKKFVTTIMVVEPAEGTPTLSAVLTAASAAAPIITVLRSIGIFGTPTVIPRMIFRLSPVVFTMN